MKSLMSISKKTNLKKLVSSNKKQFGKDGWKFFVKQPVRFADGTLKRRQRVKIGRLFEAREMLGWRSYYKDNLQDKVRYARAYPTHQRELHRLDTFVSTIGRVIQISTPTVKDFKNIEKANSDVNTIRDTILMGNRHLPFLPWDRNRLDIVIKKASNLYKYKIDTFIFNDTEAITLDTLLRRCSFPEVLQDLKKIDPETNADAYKNAWDELLSIKPYDKMTNNTMFYTLTELEEHGENQIDVSGLDKSGGSEDDKKHGVTPYTSISFTFSSWEDMLMYKVPSVYLEIWGDTRVMAEILWELTFNGYSIKDTEEKTEEFKETLKEVEERLESLDE